MCVASKKIDFGENPQSHGRISEGCTAAAGPRASIAKINSTPLTPIPSRQPARQRGYQKVIETKTSVFALRYA
jgi:hypothetical protein